MALRRNFKTTFEPQEVIQPIHTGGSVATDAKGEILATCLGEEVLLTSLQSGEALARISGVSSLRTLILLSDRQRSVCTNVFSRMEKY